MTTRTARLIQYVLDLNARGFSIVPVDHDNDIINVEFESEEGVVSGMSQMASTMGVTQLGLISYDIVGIMISARVYDLYNTLVLINDEGSPIYIFKAPVSSHMMRTTHYSGENPMHMSQIESLSFSGKISLAGTCTPHIMFIANEVMRFCAVVSTKTPIMELPVEIRSFLYNTEPPTRQISSESLSTGCYVHRKMDLLPLNIDIEPVWKSMYYMTKFRQKRKAMHSQMRLAISLAPLRLLKAAESHVEVTKAKLVRYSHNNEWSVAIESPSCFFFYGDVVIGHLTTEDGAKVFKMGQGDMLFINSGTLVFSDEDEAGSEEVSVFLLMK